MITPNGDKLTPLSFNILGGHYMKKFLASSLGLLIVCLFSSMAYGQGASANLTGDVRDDQGNALPGVTVMARNSDTGLERTDVTSDLGIYRFPSLPVGTYDITAQLQGFSTQVLTGIKLSVGKTMTANFSMKLSTTGETMEISGETPLIETTESDQDTSVSPEQVENLPLNLRQFANLGVLAPGTLLKVNNDPTRPSSLAISTVGGSGRNYNTTIDGGDNNDDTIGGINQFFPLDAVSEFTFQTNLYKAEYGRSNGGVLNVITKSGSNSWAGSVFSLFRSEALNGKTFREEEDGLPKAPYDRQQFGGSIGGPIVKDRAFFFIAAERQQQDQQGAIETGGIVPSLDGTTIAVPQRDNLFTVKGTANLDPRQFLTVRYGQQKTTAVYGNAPNYAPSARGDVTNTFHSFLASHNYVIGTDKLNEFTFQYADFTDTIDPTSEDPTIIFPNTTYLGQNPNTPQFTEQVKYQFKDDFSFTKGEHHFKTGINFVHEPTLGGSFSSNVAAPAFTPLTDSLDSPIVLITQNSGVFGDENPNDQYALYFQDDWNVNENLTLNLGVRYDYISGFDLDQSSSTLLQAVSALPYDYPWLQAFQDNPDGKLKNDTNNIAPRLGAAYDFGGDGVMVLRGGFGIYYDFPYTNANILFPSAALGTFGQSYFNSDDAGIRNADGTLFQIGDPLPPNQLTGPVSARPNDVASPDFVVPYTRQYSIGMSRQVGQNGALDVDYNYVQFRDQFLRFRANGLTVPFDQNSRLLPDFGNFRIWYNGGFANYSGFNVNYRHQFTSKLQFTGAYTVASVDGNTMPGSDEFRLGETRNLGGCRDCALNFKVGPKDDPRQEGPLDTDAVQRIVLSGIYELPWNFQVSGFFRWNSDRPYNELVRTDLDGDGFAYSITTENVNALRGSGFSQMDLRLVYNLNIKEAVQIQGIFEVFNLFNASNPTNFIGDVGNANFEQPTAWAGDRSSPKR